MKKTILTTLGLGVIAISALLFTTSCKKDDVVPSVNVANNIVLTNNNSTEHQFLKLSASSTSIVTTTGGDFDLGYFNNTSESYKYYFDSDRYYQSGWRLAESVPVETDVYTTFYSVTGINYDNLSSIADLKTAVENATITDDETDLASSTAWAVGYTFAFKTRDGIYALAKVTTAPTGAPYQEAVGVEAAAKNTPGNVKGSPWVYPAGSVTISVKYAKVN